SHLDLVFGTIFDPVVEMVLCHFCANSGDRVRHSPASSSALPPLLATRIPAASHPSALARPGAPCLARTPATAPTPPSAARAATEVAPRSRRTSTMAARPATPARGATCARTAPAC